MKQEDHRYQASHVRNYAPRVEPLRVFIEPQAQIGMVRFATERMPPSWAFIEDPTDYFIPVCTWQQCDEDRIMTDETILNGFCVVNFCLEYQEALDRILLHLEEQHKLKHVMPLNDRNSLAPYGYLFPMPHKTIPVWK